MMALTRLPSGRRASTIGDVSSTRRPTWADDALDDLDQVGVVGEDDVGSLQPAVALDVDLVGAVDEDVADGRVAFSSVSSGPRPKVSSSSSSVSNRRSA